MRGLPKEPPPKVTLYASTTYAGLGNRSARVVLDCTAISMDLRPDEQADAQVDGIATQPCHQETTRTPSLVCDLCNRVGGLVHRDGRFYTREEALVSLGRGGWRMAKRGDEWLTVCVDCITEHQLEEREP